MKLFLFCALLTAWPATPPATRYYALQGVGRGVSYNKNAMERVVAIRIRQGYPMRADLPHISLPDCAMIGRVVWLRARQTARDAWSAIMRAQTADCSQYNHWAIHTLNGTTPWVETDHPTARRLHLSGTFQVEVWWGR